MSEPSEEPVIADDTIDLAHAPDREALVQIYGALLEAIVIEAPGEEIVVSAEAIAEAHGRERSAVIYMEPLEDGGWKLSWVPMYVADDRVTPGGWVHALSGTAVQVQGVTQQGWVRYLALAGTDHEHFHDMSVETFLETHVPAEGVELLG